MAVELDTMAWARRPTLGAGCWVLGAGCWVLGFVLAVVEIKANDTPYLAFMR